MTLYLTKQEKTAGWVYAVLQQFALPTVLFLLFALLGVLSDALLNFAYYCINFVCWMVLFKRPLKESFHNTEHLPTAVGQGFAIYYLGSMMVSTLIALIEPEFANVNDANVNQMVADFPPLVFAVVFLVPVAEECLFRGMLFVSFWDRRPWLGYVLSTLCFSAVHVTAYLGMVDGRTLALCFLQYIPGGLALCYACRKADSLAAPILIHTCINTLAVISMR